MTDILHVIDNEARASEDGAWFDSIDPSTRETWARVARGSATDSDAAVAAARRAFDQGPWPRMSGEERGSLLHALADAVESNAADLAAADTADMGRPIKESRGHDVPRAARNLRFFADYARLAEDESLALPNHHAYTRYDPVGVTAAISPWNFPLMQASWKIAPALAFGNTVVLKPAEQAPASSALLGQLAAEIGFPAGVLNVVQGFGPGEAGEALTVNPGVDLITFTGETATGRRIMTAAADTLKRVSFELGGKGASIVLDDADLDRTIPWVVRAAFQNAGQICLAGSRLYVETGIYDEFIERFARATSELVVGDPRSESTDIGPLSSEPHWEKVRSYIDIARAEGATVHSGGEGEGWSLAPTILTDVHQDMRVCREEIFGPVVSVVRVESDSHAVQLTNDSPYGLSAMIFTENLRRAHRVAGAVRAGNVWVNCYFVRDLRLPFGGAGASGIGREGGRHSREFFTEAKSIVIDLGEDM